MDFVRAKIGENSNFAIKNQRLHFVSMFTYPAIDGIRMSQDASMGHMFTGLLRKIVELLSKNPKKCELFYS